MTLLQDLTTQCSPTWCPGCGDIAIWAAFKNACVQRSWDNTNTALVAGIGCHGHLLNFTKITSLEGLHGRAVPVATGLKMANNRLNVFVFTGDGDSLAEGGNHFMHVFRRNHDIKIFLHDNAIYGLTTGQTSPASPFGFKTKSTPEGNPDHPLNPLAIALAAGATFVARGYAGNIPQLTELMIKAAQHKGTALLDILQPCATWNKEYTHTFYQDNIYYVDQNYDKTNKQAAFEKAMAWGPKQIALGVLYEVKQPTYESRLPMIAEKPLIEGSPVRKDLNNLFKKFA